MLRPLPFTNWKASGAPLRIGGVHTTCQNRFLNHAKNTGGRGLEAELAQLEQPYRTSVLSRQRDCSMVNTTFALSFLIAMSRGFPCRNSRIASHSFYYLLVYTSPGRTLIDEIFIRAAESFFEVIHRIIGMWPESNSAANPTFR
jgi:hypothetical protein